jgi:hypothetical protein
MVRRLVIVFALLLAVDLWASDPWREKSYKNWDEKDVRKILNESPWSKRIEVGGHERTRVGLESPEDTSTASEAGGESGEEEGGRGAEQEKETKKNGINFVIRWGSSRTMRAAWVRSQVLQKRISEVDTEKSLPPVPGDYELLLVGPDMTLFEKADEATLKEKSYLLAKKSKQRINPSKVEFARAPDGKRIKGIIFHFPKKTPAGKPIFPANEKELEFLAPVGAVEIKASFDLQKMVDKEGTDL